MDLYKRPNSAEARDIAHHLHQQTNARAHEEIGPRIITRGDGAFVIDSHGRRLLEGMAGLWCASLGFSERRLAEVAYRQMLILPYYQNFRHVSNYPVIDLAETLVRKSPNGLSKVIFQCSGSEANDTAVKVIWYYFNSIGQPEKKKIISRWFGYHGTSVSTGSITGLQNMHRSFDLPIARFIHVSNPHYYRNAMSHETEEEFATRCAAELEDTIVREGPETIAAFFAEPVMASAGVVVPPRTYFDKIQTVLRKYDVLFVVDEVVCGFGRTGNYWGSETFDLQPDVLTCAKALSSAYFPISATLISEQIYDGIKRGGDQIGLFAHGYTYGAHPVGAAVALEALRIYDEIDVVSLVQKRALSFQNRLHGLASHPLVGETRGIGLCGAIELVRDKTTRDPFPDKSQAAIKLSELARDHGIIVRPIGQSVAFAPPLIISDEEVDFLFDRVEAALADLEARLSPVF